MKLTYTIALLLVLGAGPEAATAQELPPCGKNHFILKCIPDEPATWAWSRTSDMHAARTGHTATMLPDGRVLVAGGFGLSQGVKSAEIYDPVSRTWTETADMGSARSGHTAALLPDGRVLLAGGYGIDSAELYDPGTQTWTRAAAMLAPRGSHAMTLLADGTVLVAGGVNEDYLLDDLGLKSAEIYDPVSNSWRSAGSMSTPRYWHTLTLLANGKVLVAGGATLVEYHGYTAATEQYDPGSDSWIPGGSFGTARSSTTATTLLDGTVLVAGGYSTCWHTEPTWKDPGIGYICSHAATAVFNPATGWSPTAPLHAPRSWHTTTRLSNGQLLVAGGDQWSFTQEFVGPGWLASGPRTLASTELYDPANRTWRFAGDLSTARVRHTATFLNDGTVLVVGGNIEGPAYTKLASAEIFGPLRSKD